MHKVINNDLYGETICRWFQSRFPKVVGSDRNSAFENVSSILMGTKENRLGSLPSPERQVEIRKVIKKAMDMKLPIPILVPWGGRKTKVTTGRPDIAEVSALLQIVNLNKCIGEYYPQGLTAYVRIEDTNAKWLYREDENIEEIVGKYSDSFEVLLRVLGFEIFTPRRESSMMREAQYFAVSKSISTVIEMLLLKSREYPSIAIDSFKEFRDLKEMGWVGSFPESQVGFYLERYKDLYPNKSESDHVRMLADYFAGSKARYDLGGRGFPADNEVQSFIQLSFTPPVPGSPESLFMNTIHWRTTPVSQGRTHISPWRGKGYLKITDQETKSKITSFNDEVISKLINTVTRLEKDGETVEIDADYVLE